MKSVREIALMDIRIYLSEKYDISDLYVKKFIVTPSKLYTKENRELNNKLGLRGINCKPNWVVKK